MTKVFSSVLLACFFFMAGEVDGFSVISTGLSSSQQQRHTSSTTSQLQMAVWSDSKAVREYQDFLASGLQEIERKKDGPSVIVRPEQGPNDMTDALQRMGMGDDLVLSPTQTLPPTMGGNTEYPIYITLPPTQIESFIQTLSHNFKERNQDFVFLAGGFSYGNIEDVLREYGYSRDSMTQVLITGLEILPVIKDISTKLGADAMGVEKWAGECAACGKWNGAVAERFEKNNLRCTIDFFRDWRRKMWERNILDAAFHLVGAVRKEPTTLKDVALYYEQEVSDMVWDISQSLRGWKALTLLYGFEERLYGIAETTGSETPCRLVDELYPYIWGNRVFTESPMFREYLWYAKEQCGLLPTVELPDKLGEGEVGSTIMRTGNLRADGVI
jgi:hypothetical protein